MTNNLFYLIVVSLCVLSAGKAVANSPAISMDDATVKKSTGKLAKWCEKEGDLYACTILGEFYLNDAKKRDLIKAEALLKQACDGEIGRGCRSLGVFYSFSIITPGKSGPRYAHEPEKTKADNAVSKAKVLLRMECDSGNVESCETLAVYLDSFNSTNAERVDASKLFHAGCKAGREFSCMREALVQKQIDRFEGMTLYRDGCKKKLFKTACSDFNFWLRDCVTGCEKRGDLDSCFLAGMFGEDSATSIKYLKRACDGGHLKACKELCNQGDCEKN